MSNRAAEQSQRVRRHRTLLAAGAVVLACAVLAAGCTAANGERPVGVPSTTVALRPSTHVSDGVRAPIAGCDVFPRDHAFHADVRSLPVASESAAVVGTWKAAVGSIQPGFSNFIWEGSRRGIPVNIVDRATATPTDFLVAPEYADRSSATGVLLPPDLRIEGWPGRAWDRHTILVDPTDCSTRELIYVQVPGENPLADGRWSASTVATADLTTNRAPAWSVIAVGLSMLSGLVRYDEVASGDIGHALAITSPVVRRSEPRWPAQHTDGRVDDPTAPVMGTWFRLRADADLSGLGPQAAIVARALQVHGAVLTDTSPTSMLRGEPDDRWDDDDLATLRTLDLDNFEVVDPTPMRASADPADLTVR
jgi:hypothetical protein